MEEDQIKKSITNIADTVRTNPDMSDGESMEFAGTVIETIGGILMLFVEKLDVIAGEIEELKENVK